MRRDSRSRLPLHYSILAALPFAANGATAPSAAEMERCASITAADARLACYDALAHRPADHSAGVVATPTVAPPAPSIASSTPRAQPSDAAPAPAPAPADEPRNFGLSATQRHVAVVGPKQESAHIVSVAVDQAGHSTIVLDSGQVWMVLDDDGWLSKGNQITIKRAALGSFILTAPSHHSYRVHRIQ